MRSYEVMAMVNNAAADTVMDVLVNPEKRGMLDSMYDAWNYGFDNSFGSTFTSAFMNGGAEYAKMCVLECLYHFDLRDDKEEVLQVVFDYLVKAYSQDVAAALKSVDIEDIAVMKDVVKGFVLESSLDVMKDEAFERFFIEFSNLTGIEADSHFDKCMAVMNTVELAGKELLDDLIYEIDIAKMIIPF